MARFIYRMQNILDIKYKLEEQAKQNYMEVRARLNAAEEKLRCLEERRWQYMGTYKLLVSDRLDILEIEQCKNAILLMEEYITNQKSVIKSIEQELEEAVRCMNEAMKERKIHEKLRDNQFEIFKQELNKEEEKEIDQLVSYQYNNKDSGEER